MSVTASGEKYDYELVYASGSGAETVRRMCSEGWEPAPDTKQVDRYVGTLHMVYVWLRKAKP